MGQRKSRLSQARLSELLPSLSVLHTAKRAETILLLNEEIALFNPTTLNETTTEVKDTTPTSDGKDSLRDFILRPHAVSRDKFDFINSSIFGKIFEC